MRIALSTTMIEPAITHQQIDGVGYYTKNLLTELQSKNFNVTPVSFPKFRRKNFTSAFYETTVIPFSYSIMTSVSLLTPKFISYYSQLENNVNIFHATDHLVPKLKHIPVIATLHDALIFKHPDWFKAKFKILKNWIRKSSIHWADHIITISKSMVTEMEEYWGIPSHKISVVYNGLDPIWFQRIDEQSRKAVLKKLNVPSQFLLVVGTLQPKKNISRIVKAFLNLPDYLQKEYPLIVVGKDGWQSQESLAALKYLTECKSGMWLNYLSFNDLRALFQSAKIYLHPSLHEGFGLTILEAFASQVPVLTSNVTAMPEIAGDATHLVNPYDIDEMTHAIEKLLTDKSYCQTLVNQGLKRAPLFTWEQCAMDTLKIYKNFSK